MPVHFAHGDRTQVINNDQKELLIQELLDCYHQPEKILVLPPDITRLPSNAGKLTQILYQNWYQRSRSSERRFDILPAIGTHSPMTPGQIEKMFGSMEEATFYDHDWRNGLQRMGQVPAKVVHELSKGKLQYDILVEINQRIVQGDYDLVLSIGQVVPHEVVGMANGFKNVLVGTGGSEMINKSHFMGAVNGIEQMLGRTDTSVRNMFNYAHQNYLKQIGIVYLMTVMGPNSSGETVMRGLYAGNDQEAFEEAANLSRQINFNLLDKPLERAVVYLDPIEFKSTWLGNKAIYRTRMAMADKGELIIIAPGLKEFGEDIEIDRLIRKYGYLGTETTLDQVKRNEELQNNLSAAAHLIHGTSESRFTITYATQHLSRSEIESVGYQWADLTKSIAKYDPRNLTDGYQTNFFYIGNPAQGLWALKSQFENFGYCENQ
tara:strand:+ start:379 stop:1680 length:1302 start_codon:yes stop_codon:yes gene_type:complete